jgi:hypothetical protein
MTSPHPSQHWQLQLFPQKEAQVFESLQPFIISGIHRQSVIQFNKPNLIISMPIAQQLLQIDSGARFGDFQISDINTNYTLSQPVCFK